MNFGGGANREWYGEVGGKKWTMNMNMTIIYSKNIWNSQKQRNLKTQWFSTRPKYKLIIVYFTQYLYVYERNINSQCMNLNLSNISGNWESLFSPKFYTYYLAVPYLGVCLAELCIPLWNLTVNKTRKQSFSAALAVTAPRRQKQNKQEQSMTNCFMKPIWIFLMGKMWSGKASHGSMW